MAEELGFIYIARSRALLAQSRKERKNYWVVGYATSLDERFFGENGAHNAADGENMWHPAEVWQVYSLQRKQGEVMRALAPFKAEGAGLNACEMLVDLDKAALVDLVAKTGHGWHEMSLSYGDFGVEVDDAASLQALRRVLVACDLEKLMRRAA